MGLFSSNKRFIDESQKDDGAAGLRVVRPEVASKFEAFAPTNKDNGTTVVFVPCLDESGNVMPERFDATPGNMTNWIRSAVGVRYAGKSTRVTLFFDDEGKNAFQHNPYYLLRTAAFSAKSGEIRTPFGTSHEEGWANFVQKQEQEQGPGGGFSGMVLPQPDMIFVAFAVVFAHKKDVFWGHGKTPKGIGPNDPLRVLVMSRNAKEALFGQIEMVKGDDPLSADEMDRLKNWPVVGQKFCHFFDVKKPNQVVTNVARDLQSKTRGGHVDPSKLFSSGGATFGYGSIITETVDGYSGSFKVPAGEFDRVAKQKLTGVDWDQVLYGHTADMTAKVFGTEVGLPPGLLWFAWKGHEEWYPKDLKDQLETGAKSFPPPAPARTAADTQAGFGWSQEDVDSHNGSGPPPVTHHRAAPVATQPASGSWYASGGAAPQAHRQSPTPTYGATPDQLDDDERQSVQQMAESLAEVQAHNKVKQAAAQVHKSGGGISQQPPGR